MKKIVSVVLAITLVMTCCLAAYGAEGRKFYDVSSKHWANKYITAMNTRGVVNGYPDGSFGPDKGVSRSEFATMLCLSADIKYSKPSQQIYNDVPTNDWCAQFVHAVKKYMPGYSKDGKSYYEPNSPALREDITVALIKLLGYPVANADTDKLKEMFNDYKSISVDARPYVVIAVEMGIVSGYNDGTFRGANGVTRAEAVTLLYKASKYFDDMEVASGKPWKMRKVATARIDDFSCATMDKFNNLYYIDTKDGWVYKIDLNTDEKTKYFNPTDLSEETDDGVYTSYVARQVYYDTINNKLLLCGYYKNLQVPGSYPKNSEFVTIYDITKAEKEFYVMKQPLRVGQSHESYVILGALDEVFILMVDDDNRSGAYKVDVDTGETSQLTLGAGDRAGSVMVYGNEIYRGDDSCIYQYDGSTSYAPHAFNFGVWRPDIMGMKGECYYALYTRNEYKGEIHKISVKTRIPQVLEANIKSENVEFTDMGNFENLDETFFVIDDETFVFYDKEMKAVRMLERN